MNKSEKIPRFRRRLLKWFSFAARDLPWRRTNDPYKILVSEIMLQQTQVDRVAPKYEAFLKKFPSLGKLAQASQSDVIKMWHGLGYNRRALSLHKLAKVLVEQNASTPTIGGVASPKEISIPSGVGMGEGPMLPSTFEELIKLPGIGPYTAQAVRAFAFRKKDAAPVDTNIERVLKRVFNAYTLDKNQIQALAHAVSPKDTWTWNHALMDFGASICVARAPKCEICPLKDICAAYPCDGGDIIKIKQAKFEDSDRMYRGRLISYLRANSILRRNDLFSKIGLADEIRADRIVGGLIKEGFIKEKGGKIRLQ